MWLIVPLLTSLTAGFLHALQPDHMAAVTTFVSRRPRPREAAGFGVRWGLGHSVALLVAGGLLVALDVRFPVRLAQGLEFAVGAMLLVLALWLLWSLLHERAHVFAAGAAAPAPTYRAGRATGSFWVGVAHGLAGTAPVVALLPVTLIPSHALAIAYLLTFGVGATAGMGAYALLAGAVFQRTGHRLPRVAGILRGATALGGAALGVVWMLRAVSG